MTISHPFKFIRLSDFIEHFVTSSELTTPIFYLCPVDGKKISQNVRQTSNISLIARKLYAVLWFHLLSYLLIDNVYQLGDKFFHTLSSSRNNYSFVKIFCGILAY